MKRKIKTHIQFRRWNNPMIAIGVQHHEFVLCIGWFELSAWWTL